MFYDDMAYILCRYYIYILYIYIYMYIYIYIYKIDHNLEKAKILARRKEGGGFPCLFSEIGKKCTNFAKKCPDCGHLWVKFLI